MATGKGMPDVAEPAVIDAEMCRECIYIPPSEDGSESKSKRDEAREEVHFHEVDTLIFSFKNILKIDNLVGFDSLVKLQLDNNIISKIDNLAHLVQLEWLDLSFNNIEKIENLETLVNLSDLSLFNNRVVHIENLEAQVKLNVFSIGNNQIQSLDNLLYLRRFENLRIVNVAGNAVCKDGDYKSYLLAHCKDIRYLDYKLVDDSAVQTAREQYQDELLDLQEKEKETEDQEAANEKKVELDALYKEANLEGMDTFHGDMFGKDADHEKLRLLNVWNELVDGHKERFVEVSAGYVKSIKAQLELKKAEIGRHQKALRECKRATQSACIALVEDFELRKKKVLREYGTNEQAALPKLKALSEYAATTLWTQLVEQEMLQVDDSEQVNSIFDKRYEEIAKGCTEIAGTFFHTLQDMERELYEKGLHEISMELEKHAAGQTEDLSEDARTLLSDKDVLMTTLSNARDTRMSKIDGKEASTLANEQALKDKLVQANADAEHKRNRNRVCEIARYIESARKELDVNDEDEDNDGNA